MAVCARYPFSAMARRSSSVMVPSVSASATVPISSPNSRTLVMHWPATAPQSPSAILQRLGRWLDLSTTTLCGPLPEKVRRIGYCTGSGSSLLEDTARCGVEFFITGDVKYHTALEAEICMADVGHHSLEEEMMRRMCALLQHLLPGVNVFFVPSLSPLRPWTA